MEKMKLVRGVIYDDFDREEMKADMLDLLDDLYNHDDKTIMSCPSVREMMEDGLSYEAAKQYFHNMDAIAAMTRYNFNTGETHNLIIPKEALSNDFVKDLEEVDLGKDLYKDYITKFNNDHYYSNCVEPEDFCDSEEETMIPQDMIDALNNGAEIHFIVPGGMTKEEFASSFGNLISAIDKAVKTA